MDLKTLEDRLDSVLEGRNYELVDIRVGSQKKKPLLQVFVDRLYVAGDGKDPNGGITLDDCAALSETIGDFIDKENIFADGYCLEVSSPGMDRVLKKEKDFNRFAGSPVKIKLRKPVDGAAVFYGKIKAAGGAELTLEDGLKFKLEDILEARLHFTDEELLGKK